MKVEKKGEGEPDYTVVGSLHGDEPCGRNAIERFLKSDYEVKKPVKFIVGNEKALEENERYLEDDLNRAFPGDEDADSHEKHLAAEIIREVEGKLLDIHSTKSFAEPFATTSELNSEILDLARSANVDYMCDFPVEKGTLHSHCTGIIVETGRQGTDQAAENAYRTLVNFLAAEGVIEEEYETSDPEVFQQFEKVEKPDYRFTAENFQKVRKGETFAKHEAKTLKADREFYPVLMSTSGYETMLGHKAEKLGKASELMEKNKVSI